MITLHSLTYYILEKGRNESIFPTQRINTRADLVLKLWVATCLGEGKILDPKPGWSVLGSDRLSYLENTTAIAAAVDELPLRTLWVTGLANSSEIRVFLLIC